MHVLIQQLHGADVELGPGAEGGQLSSTHEPRSQWASASGDAIIPVQGRTLERRSALATTSQKTAAMVWRCRSLISF